MLVRLQVVLSRSGVTSRRGAANMIQSGRVTVNGKIEREPGAHVDDECDCVKFDGKIVPRAAEVRRVTIMLNKPAGLICSAADSQGETVMSLVADFSERLLPVGRLDRDSAGLLLMSNDGDLIARLTHPRYGHSKTYRVRVSGRCDKQTVEALRAPMVIDGYTIRPVEVKLFGRPRGNFATLEFVLHEGRNRQIRKMCAEVGLNVISLTRIAIDKLSLGTLPPGKYRELSEDEIRALMGN